MDQGMEIKGLPDKDLLRPNEVAEYFSVSKRTIYQWCMEEKFKYCKPNGLLRIFRQSVLDLIEKTKNAHIESIEKVGIKIKKLLQKKKGVDL